MEGIPTRIPYSRCILCSSELDTCSVPPPARASSGQLSVPTGEEQHLFLEPICLALTEEIQSTVGRRGRTMSSCQEAGGSPTLTFSQPSHDLDFEGRQFFLCARWMRVGVGLDKLSL